MGWEDDVVVVNKCDRGLIVIAAQFSRGSLNVLFILEKKGTWRGLHNVPFHMKDMELKRTWNHLSKKKRKMTKWPQLQTCWLQQFPIQRYTEED